MNTAIGELKTKVNVYCDICGQKHTRNIKQALYENTPEAITEAKNQITKKSKKLYTCRICKSIVS
jgi:recombinational DNA repair protein RecR